MDVAHVPGIVEPVRRDVGDAEAGLVPFDDPVDGMPLAAGAVVVAVNLVDREAEGPVAAGQAHRLLEGGHLGPLHDLLDLPRLVAGVDHVAAVDHAARLPHGPAAGPLRDLGAGQFVERLDESGGVLGGRLLELARIVLVGEEMGVADEVKRNHVVAGGLRGGVGQAPA